MVSTGIVFLNTTVDLSHCPSCSCEHLYRQKDFNKTIGCLVIIAGAILVPFTYGLSLLVVAVVDWVLYQRVPDAVICYKCRSIFKDIDIPDKINVFDHHIAEMYEESD